jgi:hypothetical protein
VSALRLTLVLCVTFVVGISAVVVHYNQARTHLQLECMKARGNWASEAYGAVGCTFDRAEPRAKR